MKKHIAYILCCLFFCTLFPFAPLAEENVPPSSYLMPTGKEGREALLCDGDYRTYITINRNLTLTYSPEDGASVILLEWFSLPRSYTLEYLDDEGKVLNSQTRTPLSYHEYIEPGSAAGLRLSSGEKLEVAEFREVTEADVIYELGYSPCDVLLLLKEPGQECLEAAPVLRYLLDNGVTVQLCYVLSPSRDRMGEVMESLQYLGIDREPVFLSLDTPRDDSYEAAQKLWAKNELRNTLAQLEVLSPKLIIADGCGTVEYVLDTLLQQEVSPEKVFALEDAGEVSYTIEGESLAGMQEALDLQQSQRIYRLEPASSVFLRSVAGVGGGLLDGMDTGTFLTYATPTPVPTNTPVPTDTPSPAPTSTPVLTHTPAPTEESSSGETESESDENGFSPLWVVVPVVIALAIVTVVLLRRKKKSES